MSRLLTYATTFMLIVLCELGDKTQMATLIYASNNPGKKWQVFAAAATALVACVCLEVTVGVALAHLIGPALINRMTGVVFLAIGLYTGSALAWQFRRRRRPPAPVVQGANPLSPPGPEATPANPGLSTADPPVAETGAPHLAASRRRQGRRG